MGKGDRKSKRGKINAGTSGARRKKKKNKTPIAVAKPKAKKAAVKKPAAKKAAAKKPATKKDA